MKRQTKDTRAEEAIVELLLMPCETRRELERLIFLQRRLDGIERMRAKPIELKWERERIAKYQPAINQLLGRTK